MMVQGFFSKLFSIDAPKKIAYRLKLMRIASSIIRVNPLFSRFSYQNPFFPLRLGDGHDVIVIGAGGGIGQALVNSLLQKGCRVFGTYFRDKPLLPASDQLHLFRMDITSVNEIDDVFHKLSDLSVEVDLILVAAGVHSKIDYHATFGKIDDTLNTLECEKQDILSCVNSNVLGPYLVIRRFATLLKRCQSSSSRIPQICFLSSSIGTMNNELYGGLYGYRSSKAALHALAMAVYCDLNLEHKVGLQIIGPGNVKTSMNPNGHLSPKEAAAGILDNIERSSKRARFQFLGPRGKRILW